MCNTVYAHYFVNGRLTCHFVSIVSCAVSGSLRMGNIWLRAVTVRRRYTTRRRVRKFGECFLVSGFSLPSLSSRLFFFLAVP